MKKQKGKKKAFLAVLLSAAVICQTFPTYSLAAQGPDGICPHHTEHTAQCGYREAAAEVPCNHQHTEECYKTETNCLHQHTEECYPLVPSETDETQQVRGSEPTACTHVCSEESGCITKKEACTHVQVNEDGTTTLLHDEKCGYVAAQEAAACQFVCEECKNTAAESERLAAEKAAQESQQKIDNVQSLISALPEAEGITAENLEDVKAQLAAIEAAKAELNETQQASLQMEKYTAAVERVAVVEGELEAERAEAELAAQESQQKIDNVQSLISALPEADSITAENLEDVKAQLAAIEAAKAELNETQQASLQIEKYTVAVERVAVVEAERAEAELAAQESQQKIDNVQSLISVLPEAEGITAENLEDVKAQLAAIETAKAELNETQQASLQIEKYTVAVERVAVVEAERAEAELAAQESQQKIDNVQSLISVLPEAEGITAENLEDVKAQLAAIETAKAELNETQQASLQIEKYNAAVERIAALEAEPQKAPANTQEAGNDVATVTIDGEETGYPTLAEAITAADGKTATITLLQSIDKTEEASYYDIYGGNITLSLNGCSVDAPLYIKSGNIKVIGEGELYWISFVNGGIEAVIESGNITTLTVSDSSKVTISGGDVKTFNVNQRATAIITGGNIQVLNASVDGSGNITVKGGTIESITDTVSSINYEPQSVTLDKNTLSLKVNEQGSLSATVTPNISAPGFPVWESSNEAVATVNNGIITAVGAGETTITVTAGEKTETCTVTVAEDYVATVTIDGEEKGYPTLADAITAADGKTATITLLKSLTANDTWIGKINSGNITLNMNGQTLYSIVDYLSIRGGTLTITGDGWLEAVDSSPHSEGGTVILESGTINTILFMFKGKVIVKGGTINNIMSSNAMIEFQPGELLLNNDTLLLEAGKSEQLSATVNPSISVPGFGYSWESSDTDVATVNNGTVTAVGAGTADITVKAGNKSRICKVTVTEDVASVTIGNQKQNYTDLDDAAKKVSGTGGTLTLLKDVSGRMQPLELSGPMTFDLGEHTLSGSWNNGAQGVVVINVGNVQVTNGKVKTEALATRAVNVEEGAILSGDAEYLGNNALRTKGIVSGGTFKGKSSVFENGTISGGIFEEIVSLSGSVQGGCFKDVMVDGGPEGLAAALVAGYVGYNNDGVVVWDHQTQGNTLDNFTGKVKAHTPHTYDFTTHEDGNGNYTYSEGSCPICGITAPKGAAYTVTIPKTAQLGSDTEVSVNNSLSQEKTVTVSVNETQVTLTRENDPEQTQIVSDVTFEDISVTKGQTDTEKVIFAPPVYNNDSDAVIPAGTYKGTLSFTIGMQ